MTINVSLEDGRYDRQELITWWDQDLLRSARVLLVGAGALGNEIGKNLALVGFGHITVVDMDTIEHSNLARCALFRDADEGRAKATVLAERLAELNPEVNVEARVMPVEALGEAIVDRFDLIIAGLDSRVARAWVNQACRRFGKAWIDGAIEGIRGVARVFGTKGPCYECTLGAVDRQIMAQRKSCALLAPEEILSGKVPTNATTAAIIAGIQVQELIKLCHGLDEVPVQFGRGLMFVGETLDCYTVAYDEDPNCLAHDHLPPRVDGGAADARTIKALAAEHAPAARSVRLLHEVVRSAACRQCGVTRPELNRMLRAFAPGSLLCPECGEAFALDVVTTWDIDDVLSDVPMQTMGYCEYEVVAFRFDRTLVPVVVTSEGQ